MAQLNSLIVTGDSRFLNTINGNITSANGIHRATMESTSTSTAFVLTADGIDSLYDGLIITCKNIKVASASGCTINLNGLGAKSIWLSQNNSACTTHWGLNHTYFFIYDGANSRWELQQGRDTNSTYNFSGTTFYSGNSGNATHDANAAVKNGNYYYSSNGPSTTLGATTTDGGLYVQSYSDTWVGQIAQDYRDGDIFVRGKNNGTWSDWKKPDAGTVNGYTVAKSVPSNAVFTDTNNAVTQTATSTNANYEVLFSATADNTTRTEGARKYSNLTFNPSTGTLTATKFSGALTGNVTGNCSGSSGSCTGNAATATNATSASRLSLNSITVQTGSSKQQKISLQTLMTWLITTKSYIPSNTNCSIVIKTSWNYAGNDILQLSIPNAVGTDTNYELQLAGVIIEFDGSATSYNTGEFRLRIHSSPTTVFTPTSGYTKFPVDHIAEYTCNGTDYSPAWRMISVGGDIGVDTTSVGSASAGTAIPADDITAWSAGTATSASVSLGVLTITNGTAPSLSYTAKSIPNISVSSKTVVTGLKSNV